MAYPHCIVLGFWQLHINLRNNANRASSKAIASHLGQLDGGNLVHDDGSVGRDKLKARKSGGRGGRKLQREGGGEGNKW